jgi:hypothetical protein
MGRVGGPAPDVDQVEAARLDRVERGRLLRSQKEQRLAEGLPAVELSEEDLRCLHELDSEELDAYSRRQRRRAAVR